MHKILINRALLDLRFSPRTPLLVKAGDSAQPLLNPQHPDLMCVRTGQGKDQTVYIPGASLKGVIRSAAERVLRSIDESYACDPLAQRTRCQRDAARKGDEDAPEAKAEAHAMLCLACRTFGSQAMSSRAVFTDALPPEKLRERTNRTEVRSGVAIERKTGGPSRGKLYDMECVTGGAFDTRLVLTNYELWQLAVLGLVLRDADDGLVRFGGAKTRGFGSLRVEPLGLRVDQTGKDETLGGVASLRPNMKEAYGLKESGLRVDAGGDAITGALGRRVTWTGAEHVWAALDRVVDAAWPGLVKEAP